MSSAPDVPQMPAPETTAPRSHKKRGRPANPVEPVAPAPVAPELRLKQAQENGAALAPYLIAVLEGVEAAAGLRGVDSAKRDAAALALATATAYTWPVVDPLWLVWGAAAAALLEAYKVPVAGIGKPRLAVAPAAAAVPVAAS